MIQKISFETATLLIGLGAPRTGSRWLSNYFTHHSEILMSPIRILHYFDQAEKYNRQFEDQLRTVESRLSVSAGALSRKPSEALTALRDRVRMNHDPDAYLEFFRKRWAGEKVFVDITPSYYIVDRDVLARMCDVHPTVRFLFVIRNPIDRFWSEMRLARMQDAGYEPCERLDHLLKSPASPWHRTYVDTLQNLDAVVLPQAVKVCFFETLFEMNAIADICRFLGVRMEAAAVDEAMNQSNAVELDASRRGMLYAKFEPVYRFVFDRFEGRLPDSWLRDMAFYGLGSA